MALYDDLDSKGPDKVAGWSSGIKLLQSQLALKKATPIIQPRSALRKKVPTPVIHLKPKKEGEEMFQVNENSKLRPTIVSTKRVSPVTSLAEYDWDVVDEYDPLWPNEYDKMIKELRDNKMKARRDDKKRDDRKRPKMASRFNEDGVSSPASKFPGFGGRPASEDEEDFRPKQPSNQSNRSSGAAIAPPPSLQESIAQIPESAQKGQAQQAAYGASSVAAKIMAKYGFKDGQGLGKQEQGMSIALQVEKTSKRGGRIIHEKELLMPPPPLAVSPPPQAQAQPQTQLQPPPQSQAIVPGQPSITEIMKSPSKVVLLRNMVGPGDVDNELEPEVKDECNTKYGDVISVIIHELQNVPSDEAVRIFVEFKRIESAIKAVVDLNGRFFGGRQVKAGFFSAEKFSNLQLLDNY